MTSKLKLFAEITAFITIGVALFKVGLVYGLLYTGSWLTAEFVDYLGRREMFRQIKAARDMLLALEGPTQIADSSEEDPSKKNVGNC